MKAAIYYGPKDLRLEDVKRPRPGSHEVLVQIKSTGVCGTDPHVYEGALPIVKPPVILGHEASGVVADKGEAVKSLEVGDKVCIDSNFPCGECWYCKNGRRNVCDNLQIIGCTTDGTYAEYARLPIEVVYKYTGGISFDEAAMTEPLACSLHGVDRADIKFGDSVVIIGAGPIGLMQLQLAKLRGAAQVISIEKVKDRLRMAEKFGAIPLEPSNAIEEVKKGTGNLGADVIIESSGSLEGSQSSLKMVKKGGRIVIFGAPPENGEIRLRPYDFYLKEFEFIGSFIDPFSFERALKLVENRLVDVKSLVSHRLPLDRVEDALKMVGLKGKGVLKVIVFN